MPHILIRTVAFEFLAFLARRSSLCYGKTVRPADHNRSGRERHREILEKKCTCTRRIERANRESRRTFCATSGVVGPAIQRTREPDLWHWPRLLATLEPPSWSTHRVCGCSGRATRRCDGAEGAGG